MTNPGKYLYRFIKDYDPEGEKIARNLFFSVVSNPMFSPLIRIKGSENDLFNQFYTEKILPNKNRYIKAFDSNPLGIITYFKTSARNFLLDLLEKKKVEEISVMVKNSENPSEKTNIVELLSRSEDYAVIKHIEAREITEKIKKFFTEEELKVLCHIVFKDKLDRDYCLKETSKSAIYKRVERLKKNKLPKFIRDFGISQEGFQIFLTEYLMSEICDKLC